MTIQAIIFDHDGVLANIDYRAAAKFFSSLLPLSLPQLSERWERWLPSPAARQGTEGTLWSRFWDSLCTELGLPDTTRETLHRFNYLSLFSPYPDAVDVLRLLRSKGIKIGVLSNTPLVDILEPIRAMGLAELIDVALNPETLGTSKPDAAAYHSILRAIGAAPQECLFFDDELRNVKGAAAVGMTAFFVDRARAAHALPENIVADLSAIRFILDQAGAAAEASASSVAPGGARRLSPDEAASELEALVKSLGTDGGRMSPSIYDTAQVLRHLPPENPEPALRWLVAEQREDGGWGTDWAPLCRAPSTLAAMLALHERATFPERGEAIQRAASFLAKDVARWREPPVDDLPIGVEFILPNLLKAAEAANLPVPASGYEMIKQLGAKRRSLLERLTPAQRATAAYSWEAWGTQADPSLQSATGSVVGSPSATAAWAAAAMKDEGGTERARAARGYLERASNTTGLGIAGVVPFAWPVDLFEQAFALHYLQFAHLLGEPRFRGAAEPRLQALAAALRRGPMGYSALVPLPDADDTGAAVIAVHAGGLPVSAEVLAPFRRADHFATYPVELNPSPSTTARCVIALSALGENVRSAATLLLERQLPEGAWARDKWNVSWLYNTMLGIMALRATGHADAATRGEKALLKAQRPDGGWGERGSSSCFETAYAVFALVQPSVGGGSPEVKAALRRARDFLAQALPLRRAEEAHWMGKELFGMPRVDRAAGLSAYLALRTL